MITKINKTHRRQSTIFAILFSLLIILRLLFEGTGGGVWNLIQLFFVISGLAIVLFKNNVLWGAPSPVKIFVSFSFYIWILSTLYLQSNIETIYYFMVVPFASMMTLLFYDIGTKVKIDHNKYIYLITFFIAALLFYMGRQKNLTGVSDDKMMVANTYYVLTLLPIVLVFLSKRLSIIPFVLVIFLVMLSGKRAGILAISAMLFVFYLSFSVRNTKKSLLNIFGLALVITATFFIYSYIEERFNLDALSHLEKLKEDGGSGRNEIWTMVWHGISNSNSVDFLFGHGHKSTAKFVGKEAHNDFLQVFFEYGFFAFILYISFYISMFRLSIKMLKQNYPYARHFLISIIAALFLAFFSFFIIEPRVIVGSALTWGLILADWQKFKIRNKISNY